ncbi:hypothetical protein MMC08_008378 [Hypocenomyce scalaris]|nr:hypothetical protein [Hypocenomyce scalaris]
MEEGILHREGASAIMYLSSVQSLLSGARLIMYDGSPSVPDLQTYIRLLGDEKYIPLIPLRSDSSTIHADNNTRVTHLGTSPRYFHELRKNKVSPREVTDLSNLRIVTSTGMVLSDALFEWFYDVGFPPHVHLANISGGTDLAGAFGTENPLLPVYVGGRQGPSLGTPIAVYDQLVEGKEGREVPDGTPGELVATKAFPNMPVCFWGDEGRKIYHSAYFERFDRARFDEGLVREVKEAIRVGLSRRHVPKYVFETTEIPTTANLKKVELPVKQIVSGMTIKPSGTLLNPQSLDYYYRFAKVEELVQPASKL